VTFRLTWTAILVVLLCLGCGDSKSSTTNESADREDRTTGGSRGGSSDAGPEGDTAIEADAGAESDAVVGDVANAGAHAEHDAGTAVSAPDDEPLDTTHDDGITLLSGDCLVGTSFASHVSSDSDEEAAPDNGGLDFHFADVTLAAGLAAPHWQIPDSFDGYPCHHALRVTGGAAAVDINDDGWTDLFVTRLEEPNLLYLNNGDGTFQDIAPQVGLDVTGWSNGPAFADVDGDSDLDLFVTTAGPAKAMLFINQGGTFVEEAALRGVDVGRTDACSELTSATFGDYNHDGAMDLYVSQWTTGEEDYNFLFENDGTGHFTNVTQAAGLALAEPRGYSSGFMDADGDGWEDLFVVADFGYSQLFHNNRDGTFTDVTEQAGVGLEEDGMGSALGDVNGDGFPDWFVSNVDDPGTTIGNRLYINRGDGTFDDQTDSYGVSKGGWGWGALLFDVNNDGNLDASNVSGWIDDDQIPSLWLGGSLPWQDVSAAAGFTQPINGRAYIALDFDRDGDLDVFVVQNGDAPILYRNDLRSANHWLVVKARSSSNARSIGARVRVEHPGGTAQHRWITANSNFLGHRPFEAHFGLGEDEGPFTIRVSWPASGESCALRVTDPDQVITVHGL